MLIVPENSENLVRIPLSLQAFSVERILPRRHYKGRLIIMHLGGVNGVKIELDETSKQHIMDRQNVIKSCKYLCVLVILKVDKDLTT